MPSLYSPCMQCTGFPHLHSAVHPALRLSHMHSASTDLLPRVGPTDRKQPCHAAWPPQDNCMVQAPFSCPCTSSIEDVHAGSRLCANL